MSRIRLTLLLALLALIGLPNTRPAFAAGIIYVNTAASGANNGSTWANAFTSLRQAVTAAQAGDEIWVASGVYLPTDGVNFVPSLVREETFTLKNDVAIYGGFTGTETTRAQRNIATNVTILSGDIGTLNVITDNSYNVFRNFNINSGAILDGFTIFGGNANAGGPSCPPTISACGGGMYNQNSNPTLRNLVFAENQAISGGAMYNLASIPSLINVSFESNNTINNGPGGAMVNATSNPTLTNVSFFDNSAPNGTGGAIYNANSQAILQQVRFEGNSALNGGAIYQFLGTLTVSNSIFSNNTATQGGAIYNTNGGVVTLLNSDLRGNSATAGAALVNVFEDSDMRLANVAISGNTATGNAVIANLDGAALTLANMTFHGNNVDAGALFVITNDSTLTIANTVIWGNSGDQSIIFGSAVNVSNSIIENGWVGGTNILDVDPRFVRPIDPAAAPTTAGNLRLRADSPALDRGSIAINSFILPSSDRDGQPRNVDLAAIVNGVAGTVDWGAYERQTPGVRYVDRDAIGSGAGYSWANAITDLQEALDFAGSGDELWVAEGVYLPTAGGDRTVSFALRNGVAIYGGFAATETARNQRNPAAHTTMLSGNIGNSNNSNDNSYSVVRNTNINATAILDGVTISGGYANGAGCPGSACGGGILNESSSPALTNITISANFASSGGGIANHASSPALTNVTISGNSSSGRGAGMLNQNGSAPTLANVILSNNSTPNNGGAIVNTSSSPILTNVTISGNSSGAQGGGIYNIATSNPILTNIVLSGNTAATEGGAIYNVNSSPILTNLTISGNTASEGGAIYNSAASTPAIRNSILWNNSGGAIVNSGGAAATVSFSIIEGGHAGDNNLDVDPLFVTPVNPASAPTSAGNLRLQSGSPAIEAGANSVASPALPPTDRDGNPRISKDQVDIGAYEFEFYTMRLPLITRP